MTELDPIQFGELKKHVQLLEGQVTELREDVKKLLEMANKSKGGLWMGLTFASMFGGVISWIIGHIKIG
jgi:hypothetical protein